MEKEDYQVRLRAYSNHLTNRIAETERDMGSLSGSTDKIHAAFLSALKGELAVLKEAKLRLYEMFPELKPKEGGLEKRTE